ncbi:MAG: acyl-CoA reductase-like NAD-dependent aldehyde dehydrogenase [Bradymonadia bacterium]|jgi:acyl-CoA reductase-like NAD-dependent aldehyde dehydrogenase
MREVGLFIDGKVCPAIAGETFESINPATEEAWATIAAGRPADIDLAVAAAKRAHVSGVWRSKTPAERAAVLNRMADMFIERQEEICIAEVSDGGGTFRKANTADISATMQTFQYYAELIQKMEWDREDSEEVPVLSRNIVTKEPIGVVGAIVPFNFPLAAAAWKVAPALAAGCTIVLKPSPFTPTSAIMLAEIARDAGVPDGVFNVVPGPDADIGMRLVEHPDVDKIAFTGSTAVGRAVMKSAADEIKNVTLELGGKAANIILDDANLDGAVRGAIFGTFFHSGQVCQSGTRVLVHRSLLDEFVERIVADVAKIKVGDPMDPMTTFGPLINQAQLDRALNYIEIGKSEGAKLVFGGKRPEGLDKGYFIEPTIFVDGSNDMRLAREEVFGPVVIIIPFDTDEDAIAIANDSPYGLTGAVWTKDEARGLKFARAIEAGTVWINDFHLLNPKYPFGGYKKSGIGRELGPEGLSNYLETKHIHIGQPDGNDIKYYFGMLVDDFDF